jgi:hypothetical protein
MLESLPPSTLDAIHTGETIVVSATKSTAADHVTAITILANAEMLIRMASMSPGGNGRGAAGGQTGAPGNGMPSGMPGGMSGMQGGLSLEGMSQNLPTWMACTTSLKALRCFGCTLFIFRGSDYDQVRKCGEKARRMAEYGNLTGKFLGAVHQLDRKTGTSLGEVYERLDRAVNEARLQSEHALLSLEDHISAHDC